MDRIGKNMRLTNQRQVILEELQKVASHPTASEVYDMVRKRLPRIGLGTVYRNLELLADHRIITKLEMGGEQKRFDGNATNHYHIRCLHCGRVDDIELSRMAGIEERAASCTAYEIVDHHIQFSGICDNCKREKM